MFSGAQVMIFRKDEDADRVLLRDVMEVPWMDKGVYEPRHARP
ncbi:hypothetical protein [Sphingomonas limnosediminicola]